MVAHQFESENKMSTRSKPTVSRVQWGFNGNPREDALVLRYNGRVLFLPMRFSRVLVDQVHDIADQADAEKREAQG